MRSFPFLAVAAISLAPSLSRADDALVKFNGAIGVDGVSGASGTTPTCDGRQPQHRPRRSTAGTAWAIADFSADVKANGQIRATGEAYLLRGKHHRDCARADPSGGTATLQVFATLIL